MMSHDTTYNELLEGYGIHETEWADLIHILRGWAESFIDRALGLDSAQHAQSYSQLTHSPDSTDRLKSEKHPLTNKFHRITNDN